MKWLTPEFAPSCFHHSASEYGVPFPIQNRAEAPSIDGDPCYSLIEYGTVVPLPPAPAQAPQLAHPLIWSMAE